MDLCLIWPLTPKFDSDMRQGYFLNSTCDIAINKRQRHATLAFLKIDRRHGDPPSRAPLNYPQKGFCLLAPLAGDFYKKYIFFLQTFRLTIRAGMSQDLPAQLQMLSALGRKPMLNVLALCLYSFIRTKKYICYTKVILFHESFS